MSFVLSTASFLAAVSLSASFALAGTPLTIQTDPTVLGPAVVQFNFIVSGTPGTTPIVLGSYFPGPTPFPQIGQIDIGFPSFVLALPPVPAAGTYEFPCGGFCFSSPLPFTFSLQAIAVTNSGGAPQITELSNVATVTFDPSLVIDCDGNGTPDACDIEFGGTPDCNGNHVPDSCDLADGTLVDADHDGIPDACDDCVAYPEPQSISDPGRYVLDDNGGGVAPPTYGLRLDGLCNDYPKVYTFSFEHAGAAMVLDYDGDKVRIHGKAYGGIDVGSKWDTSKQGFVDIDVTYDDVQVVGSKLKVFDEAAVHGTIHVPFADKTVELFGQADASGLVWEFDGHTANGWVKYSWGKPGCCQDFIFGGKSIETDCPSNAPELKNGDFESTPSLESGASKTYEDGDVINGAWQVIDGDVDLKHKNAGDVGDGLGALAGKQVLDLHGSEPGAIRQTITNLVAGKTYRVKFWYAIHPDASTSTARVLVGGGAALDHQWTATNKGDVAWLEASHTFVAGGSSEDLTFMGVSSSKSYGGIHLDVIRVELAGN